MNNEEKLLNIIKVIDEAMDMLEEGPISEGQLIDIEDEDGKINVNTAKFWDDNHNKGIYDDYLWGHFADRLENLLLAIGFDTDKPMRELYSWLKFGNPYTEPKKEISHK